MPLPRVSRGSGFRALGNGIGPHPGSVPVTGERRSINRDVCFGMVIAVLAGVAGLLALRSLDPDVITLLAFVPLIYILMGFAGSLWWWRGKRRWSLTRLILLSLIGVCTVMVASGDFEGVMTLVVIAVQIPFMMLMFLLMFIGAKLGYRLRDRLVR